MNCLRALFTKNSGEPPAQKNSDKPKEEPFFLAEELKKYDGMPVIYNGSTGRTP